MRQVQIEGYSTKSLANTPHNCQGHENKGSQKLTAKRRVKECDN